MRRVLPGGAARRRPRPVEAVPLVDSVKSLMARMGHESERAAMIYQHEARGADKAITEAIDRNVDDEQRQDDDGDDGPAGVPVPA
jgi:hypothetical protein